MRYRINDRKRLLSIFLAVLMIFNGIVILNTIVSADDDVTVYDGDSLNGWELDAYWANGSKSVSYTSSTSETVGVKLTIEYYAPISARTEDLPVGSVSFRVPDIGTVKRSGNPFKPITAAENADSIWSLKYDLESESYVFTNKVVIEKDKPISGGFEMLWQLNSRDCVKDFELIQSPVFRLGNEETNMTPLEFRFSTNRDFYRISLSREQLDYLQYSSDGVDNENYISYNYKTNFNPQLRARADNKSSYFIKISLTDMDGAPVTADDATMQGIILYMGSDEEVHLSKTTDPVNGDEVWGFYRFKDERRSVMKSDSFMVSYPASFEDTYIPVVESDLIVHYLDEDDDVIYNSISPDLIQREILHAKCDDGVEPYEFIYFDGNFSSTKTSGYEEYLPDMTRTNAGNPPSYPNMLLAKKLYNNEKVTFTIGGQYRVRTGTSARTTTRKTTSTSAGTNDSGEIVIDQSDGADLDRYFDFVLGDDRLTVIRNRPGGGSGESMVNGNEYDISRIIFPKQSRSYNYDVYVSNVAYDPETKKVANNRPGQNDYKLYGSGNTGTEKVFDFTGISQKEGFENFTDGVKAVYVRIKNVPLDRYYSVYYNVEIRFHFIEDVSMVRTDSSYLTNIGYMRAYVNGSQYNCCAVDKRSFQGSFTRNFMNQDCQAYNDNFVTNVSGSGAEITDESIEGMEMLYHTMSKVYLRDLKTDLTSSTSVDSKALTKAEGGGYEIGINTGGTIVAERQEADSVNEMKKFSLYTLIPPFLTIDDTLSGVKLQGCTGRDIYGNVVSNSEFESNVSFRLITYPNGDKVIATDFDFSDNPLDMSSLTSLNVKIPAAILYTDFKTSFTKSFTVKSYTMLQDSGVGKITARTGATQDINDYNGNGKTTEVMASSSDGKNYSQIVEEWEDTCEKFVKAYRDDTWQILSDSNNVWYSQTDVHAYSPIIDAEANKRATYTYRLSVDLGSHSSDIVVSDIIEAFSGQASDGQTLNSEWHGKLNSLDLTYARKLGLVPNVYYSTEEKQYVEQLSGDLYANYTSNLNEFTAANASQWSADGNIWTAPIDNIRSIVVTLSTASLPSEMIQGKQVYFLMNMTAPEEDNNICSAGSLAVNAHKVHYTVNGSYANSRRKLDPNPARVRLVPAVVLVTLKKSDSKTGNILSGAEFSFYTDTNDSPVIDWKGDVVAQNLPVNALGELEADMLIPGLYYMKETKAPPGYQLDTHYYEIDLRGTTANPASDWHYNSKPILDFKNERLYGKIVLTKLDADDPEVTGISGAEYELYDASGIKIFTNESNEYVETDGTKSLFTTDENGVLEITGLPWGGYYLKEITPPAGYELNPELVWAVIGRTVNVDEQVTENAIVRRVSHTDTEKTASVSLIKYDRDGATPLSNAWFALEKKTSEGEWQTVPGFEYIKTGRDGTVLAEELKFGTYRFKEIIAPAGYVLDENDRYSDEMTLDATTVGTTIEVSKTNERLLGSATLRKYSDDGIPLNGAKFDLYMVNGEIDPAGKLNDNGTLKNYAGAPAGDPEDVAIKLNMETKTIDGQTGMLETVTGLDWGKYYFKEFSSPSGYTKDDTIYCFEVTAENAAITFSSMKPVNERKKGEVVLNKTAGEKVVTADRVYNTDDRIGGAEFALFTSSGEKMYVKPGTKKITDPITNAVSTVSCYSVCESTDPDAALTMVTDSNGQIRVDGIFWGSYYFEETKAPEGFSLGDKVRFTVNAMSCLAIQELECEDYEIKCLIRIDKKIDAKLEVFGTPTFVFRVENIDTHETYTRMITLAGDALTGSAIVQVPTGNYRVTEVKVNRYNLSKTEYITENTTATARKIDGEERDSKEGGKEFTFNLSTDEGVPQTAEVKFTNTLENYSGISHASAINNIVPSKRKLTGFSLELNDEYIPCARAEHNDFPVTKGMLSGKLNYDDGTSIELTAEQLAAVQPANWTVDNGFTNAGQSFMLNAQYTENGKTFKTVFVATIGPYKVIESQKVIFRNDVDNKSIFELDGKRMGVNTVYFNSDDNDNKVVVSGTYVNPTVVTGDGSVMEWEILTGEDRGQKIKATKDHVAKYLKDNYDNGLRELELRAVVGELVVDFDYTGKVEEFIAPFDGIYYIEGWGAQGGNNGIDELTDFSEEYLNIAGLRNDIREHYSMGGGAGGYSYGYVYLKQGEKVYVAVGGKGKTAYNINGIYRQQYAEGGWNGGADAEETYLFSNNQRWFYGSGGGATHFALTLEGSGVLANYNSNRDEVLLVAGGGGGSGMYSYITNHGWNQYGKGGYGGGEIGGPVTNRNTDGSNINNSIDGGGQNGGGSGQFGKGYLANSGYAAGGGGGWYGGTTIDHHGATGGSGHVGTGMITGETIGGNNTFKAPDGTDETGHIGDGHARITYVYDTVDLPYTGKVGSFTAPVAGLYQLECWGAQGGDSKKGKDTRYPLNLNYSNKDEVLSYNEGGRGGYSYGTVYLNVGETIYYAVGGKGDTFVYEKDVNHDSLPAYINGGFNGGGSARRIDSGGFYYNGAGGGATHFAKTLDGTGVLSEYRDDKNSVLLVAGGGGASAYYLNTSGGKHVGSGGFGGGEEGGANYDSDSNNGTVSRAYGGTQSAAGSGASRGDFGQGGNGHLANWGSGGGGGWYGGAASSLQGGGGGSSYIGSENLINGQTIAGNTVDYTTTNGTVVTPQNMPTHNGAIVDNGIVGINSNDTEMIGNRGDGYARVTLIAAFPHMEFDYTGTVQSFKAPVTGNYKLEAWGAQGGSPNNSTSIGGNGGYTSGVINLNKDETIYVYVGGEGDIAHSSTVPGGWNGGGTAVEVHPLKRCVGAGGGATDFRLKQGSDSADWQSFDSLKSRIMVAAGGGGGVAMFYGSTNGQDAKGGAGGGLTGIPGQCNDRPYGGITTNQGGTQTSGGYTFDAYMCSPSEGGYGFFGYAVETVNRTSGPQCSPTGGGGYYGGGTAIHTSGAGGGSSFISGHTGCDAISGSSTESNITHTGQPNHYSGKVFTNTVMIDGASTMTDPDGSTVTGHTGNGYAKITYLG